MENIAALRLGSAGIHREAMMVAARCMTRAFQQGQLNLMGSLIGLSERRRTEQAQ